MKRLSPKKTLKSASEGKSADKIMMEQAQRIVELKEEVNALSLALEEYRKREKEIGDTLSFAKNKAEEIVKDAKIKHALECERLKLYKNKWQSYLTRKYREGSLAQDIEKTVETLRECQLELEETLLKNLNIPSGVVNDYIKEKRRLKDDECFQMDESHCKYSDLSETDVLTEEEIEELLLQL